MLDWETLVDVLPDGVLVVDGADIVRLANRSAAALLGYRADELVGEAITKILPPRLWCTDRGAFGRRWFPDPQEGEPVVAPIVFRRGVEIEVEWTFIEAPLLEGATATLALLRRRQEALRPQQGEGDSAAVRILRLVFEHAPVGVFHFDERGVLTACNERFVEILGSTRQRLIGLALPTLPSAEIQACVHASLQGHRAHYEGDYRAVTGTRVTPVRVEFEPILASDGRVLGGVGLAEDISERKGAERRAAQAERLASLGTLAAGVVHELQNPLAFVVANLDLALRALGPAESGPPAPPSDPGADRTSPSPASPASSPASSAPPDTVRASVENAREGAWRVATIVRDLKAFARSDEEIRRPVNVHEPLEVAMKLAANHLRHRATLQRDLRATRLVRASEPRLVQLFVNLLLNASEAIAEGDAAHNVVSVTTRDVEGEVVVSVEDTGKGITPELRDHLFEPFVTDKPGGMGLGLAICHGVVASLGGTIKALAGARRGTRFEVRLPSSEVAAQPRPRVAPSSPPSGASRRVLVVDDEERLAETIRMALSPPHDVDVCTRGRDALERLRAGGDYDVVLCDLMMPDLSGPDLFEQVKAIRPELAERFVFLTGGAFTRRTRDFLHGVPNPRLEKPFDLGTLEQIVQESAVLRTPEG